MTAQIIEEPARGGKPSTYSQEIANEILTRIMAGEMLTAICKEPDMPDRLAFYRWMTANEALKNDYARARLAWADFWAEKVIEVSFDDGGDFFIENGKAVADHARVQRARLQTDNIKWLVGKYAPRTYGDKVEPAAVDAGPLTVRWETIERVIVDPHAKPPEPPKLLEHNPGPLPASIDHMLLEAVIGLIRDCVPEADTRPGDDVSREVLTIAGDALRAHYAKAAA